MQHSATPLDIARRILAALPPVGRGGQSNKTTIDVRDGSAGRGNGVNGYVLCDHALNPVSVSAAQMMAWKLGAIILDSSSAFAEEADTLGLKQLADVRNITEVKQLIITLTLS